MPIPVDEHLMEKMDQTAAEFSKTLEELAGLYEKRFGDVIRKTVLDLFAGIIRRSPVDTGTYRASHMIANHEPAPEEGIVKIEKGQAANEVNAIAKGAAWFWAPGMGAIYIFNNLPYAEPLENGHSKQAPEGIYRQAMTELQAVLKKQILKLKVEGLFK